MPDPLLVARRGDIECQLLPALANRHGLITGATGTGKTITLQTLAENFSQIGVPVFMADVKGDLTGITQAGTIPPKIAAILKERGLPDAAEPGLPGDAVGRLRQAGPPGARHCLRHGPAAAGAHAGAQRDPVRRAQPGVQDRRRQRPAAARHEGPARDAAVRRRQRKEFTTEYGNVSAASIGAIQRGLLQIEEQGGDQFFGEPMLDISDFMQTVDGKGVVNILAADQLMNAPRLYATFLLWMLSELFELLPEVGDQDKPKLVFFFDEAHLLFNDAPKALVERIELVVRLVRSKGVGVYFVTQNPLDIPDTVLAQLGNRVQHALRAFTPRDQKAVKSAADTMRINPSIGDMATAITELAVGEALISFLDAKGRPSVTERVFVLPPGSQIGPITDAQRQALIARLAGRRRVREDGRPRIGLREDQGARRSAGHRPGHGAGGAPAPADSGGVMDSLKDMIFGTTGPRGGQRPGLAQAAATSAVRSIGSAVGRELIRGVLGSLLGGSKRR